MGRSSSSYTTHRSSNLRKDGFLATLLINAQIMAEHCSGSWWSKMVVSEEVVLGLIQMSMKDDQDENLSHA